jgi:hypothetical protein
MEAMATADRAQLMSERALRQLGSGASDGELRWHVRMAAWDWWREAATVTAAETRELIGLAQALIERRAR